MFIKGSCVRDIINNIKIILVRKIYKYYKLYNVIRKED